MAQTQVEGFTVIRTKNEEDTKQQLFRITNLLKSKLENWRRIANPLESDADDLDAPPSMATEEDEPMKDVLDLTFDGFTKRT